MSLWRWLNDNAGAMQAIGAVATTVVTTILLLVTRASLSRTDKALTVATEANQLAVKSQWLSHGARVGAPTLAIEGRGAFTAQACVRIQTVGPEEPVDLSVTIILQGHTLPTHFDPLDDRAGSPRDRCYVGYLPMNDAIERGWLGDPGPVKINVQWRDSFSPHTEEFVLDDYDNAFKDIAT